MYNKKKMVDKQKKKLSRVEVMTKTRNIMLRHWIVVFETINIVSIKLIVIPLNRNYFL